MGAPVFYGPTWERDDSGSFVLLDPSETIGYQVIYWAERNLLQPDGECAGEPLRLTAEQKRFLMHWYRVSPGTERFNYRKGSFVRIKGAGKDLVGAVLCAVELCGPCRPFRHGDGALEAVPVHAAWIQLAAVSIGQTQNTMRYFPGMFSDEFKAVYKVNLGKEIVYAGAGKLEAVTSSPRALEGGRPTFILANETHHWLRSNQGHDMYSVAERNLGKLVNARLLMITNSHSPNEDSVAQREREGYMELMAAGIDNGTMFDSLEAPPDTDIGDPESLRHGISCARGDATFLDLDNATGICFSPSTPASDVYRFYLNQIAAKESQVFSPQEWDSAKRADVTLQKGDAITLGFDGSRTDDSTALVACRISDRSFFVVGLSEAERNNPDWEVDASYFDGLVAWCISFYDVQGFYSDVHPFETWVEKWNQQYRRALRVSASGKSKVALDMRGNTQRITLGFEAFCEAIRDGTAGHDGHVKFRQHALNAQRRPNSHGISFSKETPESNNKVDIIAAALLADVARGDLVNTGKYRSNMKVTVMV